MDRNQLDRAKAVRRLFESELDRTPTAMSQEDRHARAAGALDARLGGPQWRVEVKIPGLEILAAPAPSQRTPQPGRSAPNTKMDSVPDPQSAGEASEYGRQADNEYLGRVRSALADPGVGVHPDQVQDLTGQEPEADQAVRGLTKIQAALQALLCSLGVK